MKKLLLILAILVFACTTDKLGNSQDTTQITSVEAISERVPKKKSIILTPMVVNNNPIGRIMETPVNYNGELPTDDNGGLVDWDNDGNIDDLITITRAFNQTIVSVLLNGTDEININYSSSNATLLGFMDVDGDGFMDVVTEWGNPNCYDGIIGDLSDTERPANKYNVGYNVSGKYPLSTFDILSSMIITIPKGKVNNIKWDLNAYGYECYRLRVSFFSPDRYFGQWNGYGEWGFFFGERLIKGETYTLSFLDVDNGEPLNISFVKD